jgi:hypothetical protein
MTPLRRRLVLTVVAAAAVVPTACGSSDSTAKPRDTTTTLAATTTSTGATIGRATEWRDVTAYWRHLVPEPLAEGRTAVANELAARYRGGDTSEVGQVAVAEVRTGEPLVVVLQETGVSDAVLGRDIEITLDGGDQGWAVVSARVRDLCMQVDQSNPTQCG